MARVFVPIFGSSGDCVPAAGGGGGPVELASDNFTRANSADLGSAWDECTGESGPNGFDIVSNTARTSDNTADTSETNNSASFPANQYSQVTFGATDTDTAGAGLGPTCRAATGATRTYYRVVGNADGYELIRKVAGVPTSLSSGVGTTFAAGNTLRLEVTTNGANCDWVLKKNGVQFASGTDTSPIASGRAGIGHSSTTTVGTNSLSAWSAGSL